MSTPLPSTDRLGTLSETTVKSDASTVPPAHNTCATSIASAVRSSAPRLPGSWMLSSTRTIPGRSGAICGQAARPASRF